MISNQVTNKWDKLGNTSNSQRQNTNTIVWLLDETWETIKDCGKTTIHVITKIWASPNTIIGVIWGTGGVISDYIFGNRNATIGFGHNAIEFNNNPWMNGGITLGNVIIYSEKQYKDICSHEEQHTYQAELLGPFYIPAHIISGTISSIIDVFVDPSETNPYYNYPHWWHNFNYLEWGPESNPPTPWY